MLIGFYIAALAAIATFPSATLDEEISGNPTQLNVMRRGTQLTITLSRRRFLSYLFGYLAFMSLFLFITGVALLTADITIDSKEINLSYICKLLGASVYFFWVYNTLVATLLGLHYLTDRIHRPTDDSHN